MSNALETYESHKESIGRKLDRLKEVVAKHAPADTSKVNWAHVGDLGYINIRLEEILESFSAGEKEAAN